MKRCDGCGVALDRAPGWQRLCWSCWRARRQDDEHDAAYRQGWDAGYVAGRALLDDDLLDSAIALCHPDRHPLERQATANRVTAALLGLRRLAA